MVQTVCFHPSIPILVLVQYLVIGLAAFIYLSGALILLTADGFVQNRLETLLGFNKEEEQATPTLLAEPSEYFSPVPVSPPQSILRATTSPTTSGERHARAPVVKAPHTKQVIEFSDNHGHPQFWLSTLCLN